MQVQIQIEVDYYCTSKKEKMDKHEKPNNTMWRQEAGNRGQKVTEEHSRMYICTAHTSAHPPLSSPTPRLDAAVAR